MAGGPVGGARRSEPAGSDGGAGAGWAGLDEAEDESKEAADGLEGNLRGTLPGADAIWAFNDDVDKYTGKARSAHTARHQVERDHVIEVQVLNRVFDTMPVTCRTRAVHDSVRAAINDLPNLNNTTHVLNQKKKGPFMAAINRMRHNEFTLADFDVDAYVREKHFDALYSGGEWANIKTQVVARYQAIAAIMHDGTEADAAIDGRVLARRNQVLELYTDHLHKMLQSIHVIPYA